MSKALGLIETRGLVAAIEAADAMLKTSNVKLIGKEIVKPALVTIKIVGDVAAVKASVDAGAAAAKKVGVVVSTHVIPQPDSQMEDLFPEIKDDELRKERPAELQHRPAVEKMQEPVKPDVTPPEPKAVVQKPAKKPVPEIKSKSEIRPKPEVKPKPEIKKTSENESLFTDHLERLRMEALGMKSEKIKGKESKSDLEFENMNVHQLRKLARETEGFPIQGREISKANRKELLDYFRKIS